MPQEHPLVDILKNTHTHTHTHTHIYIEGTIHLKETNPNYIVFTFTLACNIGCSKWTKFIQSTLDVIL